MGLELVSILCQRLRIAHPVIACARLELLPECQDGEGGEAASTAPADRPSVPIDSADGREVLGTVDTVLDVDDSPGALEAQAIFAPIAGASAVVHVQQRESAARP